MQVDGFPESLITDDVKATLTEIAQLNLRVKMISSFKLQENSQVELPPHTLNHTLIPYPYLLPLPPTPDPGPLRPSRHRWSSTCTSSRR